MIYCIPRKIVFLFSNYGVLIWFFIYSVKLLTFYYCTTVPYFYLRVIQTWLKQKTLNSYVWSTVKKLSLEDHFSYFTVPTYNDFFKSWVKKYFKAIPVLSAGLPRSGSWQDVKDHMRECGDVCYADVFKDGTGVVEYSNKEDMKSALRKLDDTKFTSHQIGYL